MTQKAILLKLLRDEPERWFYSYEIIKTDTKFGWLGTSIDRTARTLAEDGVIEKREHGAYVQYRALPPKEVIEYRVMGQLVSKKVIY